LRHLVLIAAACGLAGCAMFKKPAPPAPPPERPAATKPVPPRPKPVAPTPAPAPQAPTATVSPAEGCRSLALQRENDARSLGRDTKGQRAVRDETYTDCMSGKPDQ
jgi:hypothetical protein